jgi:molybdate transport system substrate-binding protein
MAQAVKIAAAGNLKFVLQEISSGYQKQNKTVKLEFIFDSSGNLTQQIANGAEFDIFMAADKIFPEKLKKMGFVSGNVKTYAYGKLVLWSNSIQITKGIETVKDHLVKHIFAIWWPAL